MVTQIAPVHDAEQRIPMPYEEYLTSLPEPVHAEWSKGEAILFVPPNLRHQYLADFLLILLRLYVEWRNAGHVISASFEMRLEDQESAREPDILFVAAENRARLTAQRLVGPADLAVEVVSEASATRDRVEKWREYQAAGVREYWIVDPRPEHLGVEFWALDEYGRYQALPVDDKGMFRSQVLPGFWLDINWLLAEELPNAMDRFLQIAGPNALSQPVN